MKLYKRSDFIKLPDRTIYSKITGVNLVNGLFSKESGPDYGNDWIEQDLISSLGYPDGITNGTDALYHWEALIDSFQEFKLDYDCAGRDGCFDDEDCFIVWNRSDIMQLVNFLVDCLQENEMYKTN